MKTPQTTEAIPAGFLASLQAERITLERQRAEITGRLSQISVIETMFQKYTKIGDWPVSVPVLDDGLTPIKAPRRRGRPLIANEDQQPSAVRATKNSGDRLSSEAVALQVLDSLPRGGNSAQIEYLVNERYGSGAYLPHILKAALNRAWGSRKIASSEPIVAGTKFLGEYYSLNRAPSSAVMAPEKTQEPKRSGTTG